MTDRRSGDALPAFQARDFLGYTPERTVANAVDTGQVVKSVWHLIRDNWLQISAITLVFVAVPDATSSWVDGEHSLSGSTKGVGESNDYISGFVMVIAVFMDFLASGLITYLLLATHGKVSGTARQVASLILPLIFLCLLTTFGIIVGLVLLVIPGALLAVAWSVAIPVLVAEKRSPMHSLRRSLDLTKGSRKPIFWLILGLVLAIFLVMAFGEFLTSLTEGLNWFPLATMIISAILEAFVNALFPIVSVALYLHLRTIKEGPETDEVAAVFE